MVSILQIWHEPPEKCAGAPRDLSLAPGGHYSPYAHMIVGAVFMTSRPGFWVRTPSFPSRAHSSLAYVCGDYIATDRPACIGG